MHLVWPGEEVELRLALGVLGVQHEQRLLLLAPRWCGRVGLAPQTVGC